MATQADGSQVNLLSLTGALDLFEKGLFKGQYKRYWFWFDEQTCSLKYYKNQDKYLHRVNEPLGKIDLQCAKVIPGITNDRKNKGSNIFHIHVHKQEYVLAANDSDSAHKWIQRLQGKRGEFIKTRLGSRKEASRDVDKYRTLPNHIMNTQGVLPADMVPYTYSETSFLARRTSAYSTLYGPSSYSGRTSITLLPTADPDELLTEVPKRSATISISPATQCDTDEELGDNGLSSPVLELPPVEEEDERPEIVYSEVDISKLQEQLFKSQNEIVLLQKEVVYLRAELESKDKEMLELHKEIDILKEEIIIRKQPQTALQMENESLKNIVDQCKRSLKSLDDEIELHKLNSGALDEEIQAERQKVTEVDKQLRHMKGKYVRLLSDQFKIPVHGSRVNRNALDSELLNENKYNKELLNMLREEGGEYPVFETYCSPFEDHLGDQYDWVDETVTQKYLCRLLYTYYTPEEQEKLLQDWDDHLSQLKQVHGDKVIYHLNHGDRQKLRSLIRRGLPFELRTHVWTSLIHHGIGKVKEAKDRATASKNMTYYQSLLTRTDSIKPTLINDVKKDLHRTLPTNRHFRSGGSGIERLERVLLAYSVHNDKVGYCQSMNMIAATGLLFLDEEMAFWFLVMIIDKLMPSDYYTSGLLGAQADLGVMKKLVADKLPRLHTHLRRYSVDVTLVTFSWFLTLFTDAFPMESALRVIDCYLLEGHKVLYRVSLAVLKLNELTILDIDEQMSLLVFLKEVVHHMFNIEEILNVAFTQLRPFPRRNQLSSLHHGNFALVRKEWNKKEEMRAAVHQQNMQNLTILASMALGTTESAPTIKHLPWDYGCVRGDQVWLCCNEKERGTLGIVTVQDSNDCQLEVLPCQVDSRTKCLYHEPSSDIILLGALDYVLQAVDCKQRKIIWSYKFSDSVLDIVGTCGKLIIGLANGSISMLKCLYRPCTEDLLQHLYIGSNAISKLATSKSTVWCGAGKTVTVVNIDTFEIVHSFTACGTVNKMDSGPQGMWISLRSSTKLSLYDTSVYLRLLEVDYTSLSPASPMGSDREAQGRGSKYRITSLLVDKDVVYIGNGSSEIFQFRVTASVSNPHAIVKAMAKDRRKPLLRTTVTGQFADTAESGGLITASTSEHDKEFEETMFYTSRRHTQVRRAGRPRSATHVGKPDNVYKMEFVKKKNLGTGMNEPTSFILPLRDKIVAGVNRLSELEKCVAVVDFKHPAQSVDSESHTSTETRAQKASGVRYLSPPRQS